MKDLKEAGIAHPTGSPVIPLVDKKPLVTKWQLKTREELLASSMWPSANNYGIRLDGLTVIDVDDGDPDDALKHLGIDTEPTGRVKTLRGYHLFFKGETASGRFEGNGTKGDILSGNTRFVVGWEYPDGDTQELPEGWAPQRKAKAKVKARWEYRRLRDAPVGERHDTAMDLGRKLARAGLPLYAVETYLVHENEMAVNPRPEDELRREARSAYAFVTEHELPPNPVKLYSPKEHSLETVDELMRQSQPLGPPPPPPEPTALDENGNAITFAGESGFVFGRSEQGKSWVAVALCDQTMGSGLYIAGERLGETHKRMHNLPLSSRKQLYLMTYAEWLGILKDRPTVLTDYGITMVVIDSVTTVRVAPDGTPFPDVFATLQETCLSPDSTLIMLDHVPMKNDSERQRGPVGDFAKAAVADFRYECWQDMERSWPAQGRLRSDLHCVGTNLQHTPRDLVLGVKNSRGKVSVQATAPEGGSPKTDGLEAFEDVARKHFDKEQGYATQDECGGRCGMTQSGFRKRYGKWLGRFPSD